MRKRRKPSASRDRDIKKRKKDIAIRERSSSSRKRAQRRRKEMQKTYRRRRIVLSLLLFFLVFGIGRFAYNKITAYKTYTYPAFRDDVRRSLGEEVFVGSTDDRSLTTAEKLADLDELYENISRNYAVTASNREDFYNFVKSYETTKKKVQATKTDQEYFDLLMGYTELLANPRTKIMDKKSYDDLLQYYRNHNKTQKSDLIQTPQAVDRYKRMIGEKNAKRKTGFDLRSHVLVLSMNDFNLGDIKKDIKEYSKVLSENEGTSKILIDLTDNDSLDNLYWQKFLPLLAHKDYEDSYLVFYRGDIIKSSLEDMKNENEDYKTSFVQNQASKYPEKIDLIDPDEYMYYDEVSISIKNNQDYKNMGIYVLVNDNTANEAMNFAKALKESAEAVLIKNSSQTEPTPNDYTENFPADYFVLSHSGLLVSVDTSYSMSEKDSKINYDQYINTDNPVEAVLSTL
jgi:hypothetical protein